LIGCHEERSEPMNQVFQVKIVNSESNLFDDGNDQFVLQFLDMHCQTIERERERKREKVCLVSRLFQAQLKSSKYLRLDMNGVMRRISVSLMTQQPNNFERTDE